MAGFTWPWWAEGLVSAATMYAAESTYSLAYWALQTDQLVHPGWHPGNDTDLVLPAAHYAGLGGYGRSAGGLVSRWAFPLMTADMLDYIITNLLNGGDQYTGTARQWSRKHNSIVYIQYQLVRLPFPDEWANLTPTAGGWRDFPVYFQGGVVTQTGDPT